MCITERQGSVSVTSLAALCPITKAVAYFSGASNSAAAPVVTTSTVSTSTSTSTATSKCPPSPISAATAACTPDVQSPASNISATTATSTATVTAAAAGASAAAVKPYNNPGIRPRSMPQAHFTAKTEHDRVPESVLAAVRAKPKLQESQHQQQQQQQYKSVSTDSNSSGTVDITDSTDKHSGSSGSVPVVAHERKARLSVSFADTAAADITERVNSHRTSITCSSVSMNSDGAHSSTSTCSMSAPNSPTSVVDSSSGSGSGSSMFNMRRRASTDITTGTKLHIFEIKHDVTIRLIMPRDQHYVDN
jgi:hypothetical protein